VVVGGQVYIEPYGIRLGVLAGVIEERRDLVQFSHFPCFSRECAFNVNNCRNWLQIRQHDLCLNHHNSPFSICDNLRNDLDTAATRKQVNHIQDIWYVVNHKTLCPPIVTLGHTRNLGPSLTIVKARPHIYKYLQ
jgi:hypothetical protein